MVQRCRLQELEVAQAGHLVLEPLRQFVDRRLAHRFAAFVCVSQGVADVAVDEAGLPRDRVHVIPNSVDAACFADVKPTDLTRLGVPAGNRVILFVGRIDRQSRFALTSPASSG